ncbi:hypothetical protein [Ferrimonas balearica]|uniref:hypothetical protein n=1 Tax=Ferrimonas balearica TaxID=44012 RepID=UPI001F3BDC26|nr:hypothetical protein [Ferrimonas balearica]MBY6093867.1 hypothetical protein [Ferrimonas balearica]
MDGGIAWAVVDLNTGISDGFYFDFEVAVRMRNYQRACWAGSRWELVASSSELGLFEKCDKYLMEHRKELIERYGEPRNVVENEDGTVTVE